MRTIVKCGQRQMIILLVSALLLAVLPSNVLLAEQVTNARFGSFYYAGEVSGDRPNGWGTAIWDSGARYEGNWINGQMEGYGTYYWISGKVFTGQWLAGKPTGDGVFSYPANSNYGSIKVFAYGNPVYFPDQQPYIINGRTMVPLRAPLEAIGASVDWNESEQKVNIAKGNCYAAKFVVGSTDYNVSNCANNWSMDVAPEMVNGRVCIPLRYAAEAMGCMVTWDEATMSLYVDDRPETGYVPFKLFMVKGTCGVDPSGLPAETIFYSNSFKENEQVFQGVEFDSIYLGRYTMEIMKFNPSSQQWEICSSGSEAYSVGSVNLWLYSGIKEPGLYDADLYLNGLKADGPNDGLFEIY